VGSFRRTAIAALSGWVLEGNGLQLHDDVATQLQVVEEQIDAEVLVVDLEVDLPADKGRQRLRSSSRKCWM
jgi:hypothetical protein